MATFIRSGLAALALALPLTLQAQQQSEGPLPCGTQQAVQELMRRNPDYARQVREQRERVRIASENQALRGTQLTPIVIPIVVHIIHDNTGTNISREQVMDAVRMINEDFNYRNADTVNVIPPFKNLVGNVGVEFRLAQLDPFGNCTDGITRTYSPLTHAADDNVKDLIRWNPDNYLNIWVVRTISFGAGGYAYYPCAGPDYDGIVVRNAQFGSIGTSSPTSLPRSLTHEIGHYLDLPHTWGDSNDPGLPGNCSDDDGVADTPNTIGVSGGGCNTSASSCGNLSNVQNVMDYASCQLMFTHGQKAAMLASLNSASCRTNLWSSANLIATGTNDGYSALPCAPEVNFATPLRRICEGTTVQFTDMSYNAVPDSTWTWSWSFPGGSPATSSDKNPYVNYVQAGVYPVTLTVTNAGGSNTLTRTDYMEVKALNTGLTAPVSEGFESAGFPVMAGQPLQSWEIEGNSSVMWERTTLASASGAASLRIRHEFSGADEISELISPNLDVTSLSAKVLTFKIAYTQNSLNTWAGTDRLRVYYSIDCGQNWVLRYAKSGSTLQTTASVMGEFMPTQPAHWRQETVTLPASASRLMVKFESTSGQNNTLFLDDINLSNGLVGLEEAGTASTALWVYPNPSQGQALVRFYVAEGASATLLVTDALGRQIGKPYTESTAGEKEITLKQMAGTMAPGVYFIQLQTANGKSVQKLVIH